MKFDDADSTDALTHELTEAALAIGRPGLDYNPERPYGNILADATHGQSQNWTRHLVPMNTVDAIRDFDDLAEGVARIAEHALEALNDYAGGIPMPAPCQIVGVYKAIAGRFGVGAAGERYFAETRDTLPRQDGDEDAGIDVRTEEATYQVKTGDSTRSDKSKKDADHLVWVIVGEEWEIEQTE